MGMKSAACWFALHWSVRTSALGELLERTVSFDLADIVQNRIEELNVATRPAGRDDHYTELVLEGLHNTPQGRTIGKIKEHLASIYRVFLRDNTLVLTFNDEPLQYETPPVLNAPFYRTPAETARQWRKEIDFDFGDGFARYRLRSPQGKSLRRVCRIFALSPQSVDSGKRRRWLSAVGDIRPVK